MKNFCDPKFEKVMVISVEINGNPKHCFLDVTTKEYPRDIMNIAEQIQSHREMFPSMPLRFAINMNGIIDCDVIWESYIRGEKLYDNIVQLCKNAVVHHHERLGMKLL